VKKFFNRPCSGAYCSSIFHKVFSDSKLPAAKPVGNFDVARRLLCVECLWVMRAAFSVVAREKSVYFLAF